MSRRTLITFSAFVLHLSFVSAAFPQIFPFHHYTVRDGLLSNSINVLYQDSRGLIWIGSSDGISMFDGRTFANYTKTDGLAANYVNDIIGDRRSPGTMWIATFGGGVSRFRKGQFTNYRFGTSPWTARVHTVLQDHEGTIWCGTDDSLLAIRNDSIMMVHPGFVVSNVHSIIESGDTLIWFENGPTFATFSFRTRRFAPLDLRFPGKPGINAMHLDRQGSLWFALSDGTIAGFSGGHLVTSFKTRYRASTLIGGFMFLTSDDEGYLWAGSYFGVLRIPRKAAAGQPVLFTTEQGLQENTIRAGLIDRESNLWIGGNSKGISKLVEKNLSLFPLRGINPPYHFALAASDPGNHIWATAEDGLWEFWKEESGRWKQHRHANRGASISSIVCSPNELLWLGYSDARIEVYRIFSGRGRPSTLVPERTIPSPKGSALRLPLPFIIDRHKRVWYSIHTTGVVLLTPETGYSPSHFFGERDGIPVNYVRTLLEDRHGNIWAGSFRDGIVKLASGDSLGIFQPASTHLNFPDQGIRALKEDRYGTIWVGTQTAGAVAIRDGEIQTFGVKDGLPSNTVLSFCEDAGGRLWVGTKAGPAYLDSSSNPIFHSQSELRGQSVFACGVLGDSTLWFLTHQGLLVQETKHLHLAPPPPVFISRFAVNGIDQNVNSELEFRDDQNNCIIEFIGISFRDEKAVRYEYRLRGIDEGWLGPASQNSVTFAALPPGRYTFEVQAISPDGVTSAIPASLSFAIAPPYWQRWWFFLLAGGAVSAVVVMAYRSRVAKLLELERMRVRIASDLHDDVGSTLTKISIQSELLQRDPNPNELTSSLKTIGMMSRELVTTMSDIVWSIDARNDTLGDLVDRMHEFSSDLFAPSHIQMRMETDHLSLDRRLPVDVRQNIYLIFKEAMNNAAKYAEASAVEVRLAMREGLFSMEISDNGKGIASDARRTGHGLRNMQMRAERIRGRLEITGEEGRGSRTGTRVILTVRISG